MSTLPITAPMLAKSQKLWWAASDRPQFVGCFPTRLSQLRFCAADSIVYIGIRIYIICICFGTEPDIRHSCVYVSIQYAYALGLNLIFGIFLPGWCS